MQKIMYHATDFENTNKINEEGLKPGFDGIVYLTEKPEEALRFVALRLHPMVTIFEVEIEEEELEEQFDHNEAFFKCKAYGG